MTKEIEFMQISRYTFNKLRAEIIKYEEEYQKLIEETDKNDLSIFGGTLKLGSNNMK